uniref:Uncharacterized protein n=1 Tax=Anguilla anguilla TaxID=7936 RepID=A0A0E9RXQ6_ANGAN
MCTQVLLHLSRYIQIEISITLKNAYDSKINNNSLCVNSSSNYEYC